MSDNERLASLETKLEFLKELLIEVRDDLKGSPTKSDYDKLENRVLDLEKFRARDAIKVGIASGIIGIVAGIVIKLLMG